MPRFFSNEIYEDKAFLSVSDSKHASKVLRMKEGDVLTLSDGNGMDFDCVIKTISDKIELSIIKSYKNETEPTNEVKITLYQCLPKSDKLDFIVQKAVELGVYKIVPIVSHFCVARSSASDFEKKRERLQKIALEAAKQSGRGIIPEVAPLLHFKNAVEEAAAHKKAILFYEHGGKRICDILNNEKPDEISIFIGSEGGFDNAEVIFAKSHGIDTATLGKLILRCETAPIAGIALTLHEYGIM